jgi:hypothetical protein
VNFDSVLFEEPVDTMRIGYPTDHPLAAEFEEQMIKMLREYRAKGQFLSPHHPD